MRPASTRILFASLPIFAALSLCAQDTRTVTEPKIPRACLTLDADIIAVNGAIALADEQKLSTTRIQNALDQCAAAPDVQSSPFSRSVVLRSKGKKNIFITGPLTLRPGVVLVVSKNTALVASRDPRLYDVSPGSCGIVSTRGRGCKPLITGDGAANSGIMGEGSIDARGGADLLGQNVTWWDLAHQAKITDQQQSVPSMISLRRVNNFILYKITLRNSPGFHVAINQTDGFTAWGVKIMTPKTARNTDGIDPGSSRNITIAYSYIHTGDDDVCLKPSAAGSVSNMSVLHNHFYSGHGMSIGSGTYGGVDHLLVDDLTIDGADNGLRIKSDPTRGGLVHQVVYRNVCIRDVRNPLVFTPHYTNFTGDRLPIYNDITLENVHILTPGAYTFYGLDPDHKLEIKLDNVVADDQQDSLFYDQDASITVGPRLGNLEPKGNDVTITEAPGSSPGQPLACDARFVPFPEDVAAPEMAGKIPPEDKTYYVAADGTGDYYSVQRALDMIPKTGGAVVSVAPGTYREVITINKPNVTILSANPDAAKTVVINDRSAGQNGGTLHSATVNVTADNFSAQNITFANDFNTTHPQLPAGSQALALLVTGDRAIFHNVRLLGNQDTVYLGTSCGNDGDNCPATRQYFSDCYIEGNVDFIFGDSKAAFENCEIHSTPHKGGFITAQSKHYPTQDSGFVFDHCKLTAGPAVEGNVYLGRPWRPYATVIFMHTWMGDRIDPAGWREWHPGETHSLETVYYAEFDSSGPGAHHDERDPHTHFLTPEQAQQYDPAVFLRGADNWDPTKLPAQ
ncbi:MAG TPA: pectinesterase family protein [Terracidiphilus sp.]|nr:pectinesterase family protein [Terracidiphilus sp.]